MAQRLLTPADSAVDLLETMGPMQGQDLTGVLSSLALRLPPGTDVTDVRDAFTSGDLVRGYPMRSTVFAMSARDAGWITELCAGQQRRDSTRRWEKEGLSPAEVTRALPGAADVQAYLHVNAALLAALVLVAVALVRRIGVVLPPAAWWAGLPLLCLLTTHHPSRTVGSRTECRIVGHPPENPR